MTIAFVASAAARAEAETDNAEVVSTCDRAELELDAGLATFGTSGIEREGVVAGLPS
jgi:hypothetical protein